MFNRLPPSNCIALVATMFAFATVNASAGERKRSLDAVLKGADRVQSLPNDFVPAGNPAVPFELNDAVKIAELIDRLDFDDTESGFHCMCLGDTTVTFFKGDKKLAVLSHHHGRSLRWNSGKWDGDSLFTEDAATGWREWFSSVGEPRFEQMHEEELAEARKAKEVDDRFMSFLKPEAKEIFTEMEGIDPLTPGDEESGPSPASKKLVALYGNGGDLAVALAGALGSLTVTGAQEGSWSVQSVREMLVFESAETLDATDFRKALESDDSLVLAGAARMFFSEQFAALLPETQRGSYAAKLCRVVIRQDKCGNIIRAVSALGDFRHPETIALLEQLADGSISTNDHPYGKEEPQPRCVACLLLAKFGSVNAATLAKDAEKNPKLNEIDKATLRIARCLAGERDLLDKTIFEIDSYSTAYGALEALEREGSKSALDSVIMGGTMHAYANIREEAVLTAQRMTGRKWFQEAENERAEWHGKEIREWWQQNRDSFIPPPPPAKSEQK
jgi:hypothetical protein